MAATAKMAATKAKAATKAAGKAVTKAAAAVDPPAAEGTTAEQAQAATPALEAAAGADTEQPPKPTIGAVVYVLYDITDWYKAEISTLDGDKATVLFANDGLYEVDISDGEVLLELDYLALMAKK